MSATGADGEEPDTTRCSPLVRVASTAANPAVMAANPGKFTITYTYLFRADDGQVVMIDGGFTVWITGGTMTAPVVQENFALKETLNQVVAILVPGKALRDVAAVYFEHAHPDHTMQASWVHEAKRAPLDIWVGQGDLPLLQSSQAIADCTGQLPPGAGKFVPLYLPPEYVIHSVPTAAVAASSADWLDGGHGIFLIPAPSHTRGTLLVFIPSLNVVVASNHLRRGVSEASNDCATDSSTCKSACDDYWRAASAIPLDARVLHVHREDIAGGG